jgi:hypothetical protein
MLFRESATEDGWWAVELRQQTRVDEGAEEDVVCGREWGGGKMMDGLRDLVMFPL